MNGAVRLLSTSLPSCCWLKPYPCSSLEEEVFEESVRHYMNYAGAQVIMKPLLNRNIYGNMLLEYAI